MASIDRENDLKVASSIAPGAARNASTNGSGVDTQGFDAVTVVFNPATITDGTHTPKLQESDDNSTFSDVAAGDQGGTLAAIASNTIQKVSYLGLKRYVRAVITVAGATTGGVYDSFVILSEARKMPK